MSQDWNAIQRRERGARRLSWRSVAGALLVGGCLWGLAGLASGVDAWAAPRQVRVVVLSRAGQGITPAQGKAIRQTLRSALRKRSRLVVPQQHWIEHTLYTRPVPAAVQQQAKVRKQKLKKHLAKGKKLYHVTLFPLKKRSIYALKMLHKAEKEWEALPKTFREPALRQELTFYLALAYLGKGEGAKAITQMRDLIRLAPAFAPEQNRAPKEFVSVYNSIAEQMKRRQYTMKIDTVPSGANVYHNHRLVGKAPVTLSGLVPGRHAIRLTKMKFLPWERVANLTSAKLGQRKVIKVKIPLKKDPKLLTVRGIPLFEKGAQYSDDILDRLEQIAARLRADYLYVIEPRAPKAKAKAKAKGFTLKVAVYKKGVRTIYYQSVSLGQSLDDAPAALRAYSKKVRNQVTSNHFKPPKPIK